MDIVIGDPHNIPHPIKWIGNLIAFLDRKLLGNVPDQIPDPTDRNAAAEKRKGALLAATVILITALLSVISVALPYLINVKLGIIAEAVLTCYVLAATSLRRESMKVYHHLASGDIEGARKAVSMIVGRDTSVLDETGITKAAVETVAENFSDGVIAPMIYTAIGGPAAGLIYKSINTMDSMIGYRNDRYMNKITDDYEFILNRKKLYYLSNRLTLDYHPRVIIFVEGDTEEVMIPKFFELRHFAVLRFGVSRWSQSHLEFV